MLDVADERGAIMSRRSQPLYRDTSDKMISGVCSGLGRYFDIDTTLVRVLFIVLALVGGGGILAYLLLAILLDPAPPGYYEMPPPPVPPPLTEGAPRPADTPVVESGPMVEDRVEGSTEESETTEP